MKKINEKQNPKRGITLIALVVTIVVLLILASVSITVILGDNGLIEMAKSAKDKTNEAVKNDLDDIQKIGNELYNFINPSETTIGAPKRIDDYGKMVENYKDTDNNNDSGGYRLFYQDKNYTYLISDNVIPLEDTLQNLCGDEYPNGASITENSIGQRLNPMLKDAEVNGEGYNFFSEENKYSNIRAVGYLTDPKNWTKYANGEDGVFAIGGPTIELFAASYNTMPLEAESTDDNYKIADLTLTVEKYGYGFKHGIEYFKSSQRNEIYIKSRKWQFLVSFAR